GGGARPHRARHLRARLQPGTDVPGGGRGSRPEPVHHGRVGLPGRARRHHGQRGGRSRRRGSPRRSASAMVAPGLAFGAVGFVLHHDVAGSGAPYYEVMSMGGTPALDLSGDWVPMLAIENGSAALGISGGFPPIDRALYHY